MISFFTCFSNYFAFKHLLHFGISMDPKEELAKICEWRKVTLNIVQIFRRIHAYLSFHIYFMDILHFSFLMHVTSKRGP